MALLDGRLRISLEEDLAEVAELAPRFVRRVGA
jgi:hypothetical protein